MSEARNYFGEYGGARMNIARLRFSANEPLREHLQSFFNQPATTAMGRGALFLYSEKSILYTEDAHRLVDYDELSDVAGLQEVDELQNNLRHRTGGQRRMAPDAEFKRLPDDEDGMLMRMGVVIDELTARVLRNTVFMEDDRTVKVGLKIHDAQLDRGKRLIEARDRLADALQTGQPVLAVDSLDLVTSIRRP